MKKINLLPPVLISLLNSPSTVSFRPCTRSSSLHIHTNDLQLQSPTWSDASWRNSRSILRSSLLGDDDLPDENDMETEKSKQALNYQEQDSSSSEKTSPLKSIIDGLPFVELFRASEKLPPIQVDDTNLLLYDVFLIVNLTLSISFWVTHRMDFEYLPFAFSEGCLLSIFWVISGLYHGMFLYSSVDGHYGSADERGGPKAAAMLALNTYVNAVNLKLLFAFLVALAGHRQVGVSPSEQLLPLEIGFGLLLMSSWRALHSSITPRL